MVVEIVSTATTSPENAAVHLVYTPPSGVDQVIPKGSLTQVASTKDTPGPPKVGAIKFQYDKLTTAPGRHTYEFVSTGLILDRAGGAFGVARPHASTST